ncbi:phosphotransferase enzyme family protein [Haloplasma contractile]|uniref:Homoserine kinase type II protein n=1 Tax=Haloplasma contractile SSD-17B TaxID=1033810 RepID=U2FFW7_9MOLU|nr:phosphotransferase [Haloplasma contractile]ERJ11795.1 homoserine kinase type II protein [Haloplasma contractile SSD-17B]
MNKTVLENWDIGNLVECKTLNTKVSLIETEDHVYILKLKKDSEHKSNMESLKTEHKLIKYLLGEGLNVPRPIKTKQGTDVVSINNDLYCLYEYIEGSHVLNHYEADDLNGLAYKYGEAISKLHKGLAIITDFVDAKVTHFLKDVNAWAIPLLEEHDYIEEKLQEVIDYVTQYELIYESLPKQLIHRDLHPNNLLLQAGVVSGFLDFEISVKGIRLFDLCYACTALLGEAVEGVFNKDYTKIEKWKMYVSYLMKGYHNHNELTEEEIDCIPLIMILIQFIMSAYFLSTDESDLTHQNLDSLKWVYENRKRLVKQVYKEVISLEN